MASPSIKPAPLKPSARHDHVFAIVRFESDAGEDVPIDVRVSVTKIVTDPAVADAEVHRLNELNHGKGSYYFSQVTRIEKSVAEARPLAEPESASAAAEHPPELDEEDEEILDRIWDKIGTESAQPRPE
ncbi:MAG: hypothetical protein WD069_04515 [Planctomycetales bacterium]